MPTFTTSPPPDPRGNALALMRTPPVGSLKAIVTSTDLIGCHTHFYHGRTMPCEVENCKACNDGMPFRWHAWVAAYTSGKLQHILFEMTAQAAEAFVQYREANGTLRGCLFDATRPNRRPNGRVHITTRPANLAEIQLPAEPNLLKALSIIWNIATVDVDVAGILKNMPRMHVDDQASQLFSPADGNGKAA